MGKNREFVSASGTAYDVVQKLAQAVYARGGDDDSIRRVISDEALRGKLADLIVGTAARTLAQMVAAGRYDWANSDINEKNFKVSAERFTADGLEAIHFGKVMTTAQVEINLDRRGLRSAWIEELLAYGAENPEEQRKFPIVALGSSWVNPGGGRGVLDLCGGGGRRGLSLRWGGPGCRWDADYRFLARRK